MGNTTQKSLVDSKDSPQSPLTSASVSATNLVNQFVVLDPMRREEALFEASQRHSEVALEPLRDGPAFIMEAVPVELWELMFSFCDSITLAVAVPRICRYTRNIVRDNSAVWRLKCKLNGLIESEKSKDQTWKKYFFGGRFKLFPLLGFTIGQSRHAELSKAEGAVCNTSGSSRYVTIQKHNFWVESGDKGVFTHMYIARGIYPIPKEWQDFGITWERSWLDYKALFKKWNGNYLVVTEPCQKDFQNKPCFSARLTSIARQAEDLYCMVDLNFNYHTGTETSTSTLYSISISSHNYVGAHQYKERYEKRELIDKAPP